MGLSLYSLMYRSDTEGLYYVKKVRGTPKMTLSLCFISINSFAFLINLFLTTGIGVYHVEQQGRS